MSEQRNESFAAASLDQIDVAEARRLWIAELRKHGPRGWHTSKLSRVMFDWRPADGPTAYDPAPGWPTIASRDGRARRQDYLRLQQRLIEQGYRFADAGAGQGRSSRARLVHRASGRPTVLPAASHQPLPISVADIVAAMQRVMAEAHPTAVRQEQILRTSFISRLPVELAQSIGTMRAAVHPEMPTPSQTYQRTGSRPMRARYDLGFGHATDTRRITGVMELKAGISSLDQQFSGGLVADFEKLLDPLLPSTALRISWLVTMRRARSTPTQVTERAASLLAPLEARLGLGGRKTTLDSATGWLIWRWESGVALHLAWYQPRAGDPARFASVWT